MAEETRRVRELVEATIAKAHSVHGEVESHVAQMAVAAEANAARAAEHVSAEVKRVGAYSDAQASRVTADITVRLEHEVQAAATSTAATAELTTRMVVEGVRRDIQAQLDANRADALKHSEEVAAQVRELFAQLASLAEQLNKFNPASERNVGMGYAQVVADVDKRFAVQQEEIKTLSTTILDQQKSLQSNAETLHSLLTGVENLGDNVRNLQEEMVSWQTGYHEEEEEYANLNEQLLQEVPLAPVNPEPTVNVSLPEVPTFSKKAPVNPIPHMPIILEETVLPGSSKQPVQDLNEEQMHDVQNRWKKLAGVSGSMEIPMAQPPIVQYKNGQWIQVSQSTTPQIFGSHGSQAEVAKTSQPFTVGTSLPKRIKPIRVEDEDVIPGKPSVRFADKNDLATESTTTDEHTHPTIGETTISTHEVQKIRGNVHAVMHEQFAEGHAALRANLGLPTEEVSTSGKAASTRTVDLVSSSVNTVETQYPVPVLVHQYR